MHNWLPAKKKRKGLGFRVGNAERLLVKFWHAATALLRQFVSPSLRTNQQPVFNSQGVGYQTQVRSIMTRFLQGQLGNAGNIR